ncbi:MAG TPA: zinc ABC transporter substrate-binding protein [Candidatus Krumholzibacteria bacterium]|nr:zinc ABC transporter substrate-binding protein [Candidatus Krumholzibacteria bacterium]HRX49858.1 zinc ABC transporter substrate-binding protein [Candidatus Krumholzibacteria bacterium]
MRRLGALTLLLLLLGPASGCGGGGGRDDGRLHVVATTGQVGELARLVGGDLVRVTVLMGPGVDPHLYKATFGDVERLRSADLVAVSGLHLEAKMGEVLTRVGEHLPSVAVAEAVPPARLLAPPGSDGAHDPHVWFDVALWSLAGDALRDALIRVDPEHAAAYRANADAARAELAALDVWCRDTLATIPPAQRVLITAHDAFAYLGHAYGLEVRGLQGISTATEAGTGDVQGLAAFIAERRIPAIFVETSVSRRAIDAVRAAVRARGFDVALGGTLFSDALGDPGTPAGTYEGTVRHNVRTIAEALGGKAAP